MNPPAVSVIMPVYNGAVHLPETLASLGAQLFTDFEIVAVDDGSTDGSLDLLRHWPDPRLRVIAAERNGGPVPARNRAVAEARGRYIAALDADDLARPERMARQVAYLDAHSDVVLVGAAAEVLADGRVQPSAKSPHSVPALIEWLLMISNPLVWSSVMIRGDAARRLDPFTRPERVYAEDFDLYHRLMPFGRIARLDESLTVYRAHAGGISKKHAEAMAAATRAVLADAYAPVFEDAAARAGLVQRHVLEGVPAPDRATLKRLGETITALQAHLFATRAIDREARKLIRWETARLWRRLGQAGLRSGALALGDALATRIDHLGLGYAGPEELLLDRAIGTGRALRRRVRGG